MTSAEYLTANVPRDPRPGSAAKFLSLQLHYDPYSPTAEEDYEALRGQLDEFDLLGMLRAELFKGRVDIALTRRLVGALKHMPAKPRDQAVVSLLENLETLAPIVPHVMRAIRDSFELLSADTQDAIHARLRALVESKSHLAQVDVNLAYMIRVLSLKQSQENEQLLVRLFSEAHGYAAAPSPNIQRDILLTLAKWRATYWLHDVRQHYPTMHAWVQRAFLIGSYSLGDEGRHWRQAIKNTLPAFDCIVRDWAASRQSGTDWEIPL